MYVDRPGLLAHFLIYQGSMFLLFVSFKDVFFYLTSSYKKKSVTVLYPVILNYDFRSTSKCCKRLHLRSNFLFVCLIVHHCHYHDTHVLRPCHTGSGTHWEREHTTVVLWSCVQTGLSPADWSLMRKRTITLTWQTQHSHHFTGCFILLFCDWPVTDVHISWPVWSRWCPPLSPSPEEWVGCEQLLLCCCGFWPCMCTAWMCVCVCVWLLGLVCLYIHTLKYYYDLK